MEQKYPIIQTAKNLISQFYWLCFYGRIGSEFHSFIEFNGIMSAYVELVENTGLDPHEMNTHTGKEVRVIEHKMLYLAEKLNCIFEPFFKSMSKQEKKAFIRALMGEE